MGCCESLESDEDQYYPRAPQTRSYGTIEVPPTYTPNNVIRNPVTTNVPPPQYQQARPTNTEPPPERKPPVRAAPTTRSRSHTPNYRKRAKKDTALPTHAARRTTSKPSDSDVKPPPPPISVGSTNTTIYSPAWDTHELLAETKKIDTTSARNIVQLFENENTIPFICRYRRDLIGDKITPDRLRDIKNAYTEIVSLRKRLNVVISDLEHVGVIGDEIRGQILGVKTLKELELLHTVYKPTKKTACQLGLDNLIKRLLHGSTPPINLATTIEHDVPELNTAEKVKEVFCEAISLQLSTNITILTKLHQWQTENDFTLKCTKTSLAGDSANVPDKEKVMYEKYFKFENNVDHIKSHQMLAINRGEKLGLINVQIIGTDKLKRTIKSYIHGLFMSRGVEYELRSEIFEMALERCYNDELYPLVCRQVRAKLTDGAQHEAVEIFAKNLKELLLMPPLKGEPILGIDPGFKNGCKLAMISETADLLGKIKLYPLNKRKDVSWCGVELAKLLSKHNCKVIALGNGTGCRETESWLRDLFDKEVIDGQVINYAIVSEQGASVYSCSEEARKEFPNLDYGFISAVSIARRLNDPLSEYAKIEPRHLGVGMYQHDINQEYLEKSLNEVVTECVSFVGVDINTASFSLLKHVAGLNETRAKNIIQYRQKSGPFHTRKDLLMVPSMDEQAFQQCAGFIRIEPKSVGGTVSNLLDCTWVHPESYMVAMEILELCQLDLKDIGQPHFIAKIKSFAKSYSIERFVEYFQIPTERVTNVLAALQRELFQDYRKNFEKKFSKQKVTQIQDLFIGEIVTGEVRNVVHFGAFIDIGLKKNALIHHKNMNKIQLKVGNRVSATVLEVDELNGRVDLRLDEVI